MTRDAPQEVGHVLLNILARSGRSPPFAPEQMRPGSAPPLVLRNWNLLAPVLADVAGVDLKADDKALIVAGEREPLALLLAELKARVGTPSYAPPPQHAASTVVVAPAANAPAEEAAGSVGVDAQAAADRKELLMDSLAQLVGLYSIIMACLLLFFVEQTCPPTAQKPEWHACTVGEDFSSPYELAVIVVNVVCLFVFVVAQALMWLREKFIIEHFEEDEDLPGDNLPQEIALYPLFLDRMRNHNKRVYITAELLFGALLVNFALSAVVILRNHCACGVSHAFGPVQLTRRAALPCQTRAVHPSSACCLTPFCASARSWATGR